MMNKLFKRVFRKIYRIVTRLVRYNGSFKPTRIYETSIEFVQSGNSPNARYVEVYPAYLSHVDVTPEFEALCSDFVKPRMVTQMPASFVVKIPHGRLYTDTVSYYGIISADNGLVGDVSYQHKVNDVAKPAENGIFKQQFFVNPRKLKGTLFHTLIGGSGTYNYFHWLFDVLPRIHLLKESGLFDTVDHFLVPAHKFSFQEDTLRRLGIPEAKIVDGEREMHVQADTLIASSHARRFSHMPHWVCQFLRDSFLPGNVNLYNSHPLVYISRRDADVRNILNEEALLPMLNEFGFQRFELATLTFEEQVRLFANADVIIAPHGAGLSNLVFCKEGAKIVELFADGYVMPVYHDLAQKVNLSYQYLLCPMEETIRNVKQGMRQDMVVEQEALRTTIERLIPLKTQGA